MLRVLAALSASLFVVAPLQPVAAQTISEEIFQKLSGDLDKLSVNNAVWMAQHLPAMMPSAGIGAGSGLSDDGGSVTLGAFARVGFLNNFKDVGKGLQLADIEGDMPNVLPWPQIGIVAGFGVGDGIELGVDVQFIPNIDIASDDIELKASMLSIAATFRWRMNKADGVVPAFVLGVGGGYYFGEFQIGGGLSQAYMTSTSSGEVVGSYEFNVAPVVEWELWQVSPELRVAWDIGGIFRPYLGVGLGLTFGTVADTLRVDARASIDSVGGQPPPAGTPSEVTYSNGAQLFSTDPGLWTLRPHLGFDLVLGIVALTVQVDLAVVGKDSVNGDLTGAAASFPTDEESLFADSKRSKTNAAAVLTTALRVQF